MQREVLLQNQRIKLSPTMLIGTGGEAEVFDLRGVIPGTVPLALKVWMPPDHPAFAGSSPECERNRLAAEARLKEYGAKLRAFPHLPREVVSPQALASDRTYPVAGYSMEFVEGAEQLRSLALRAYRVSKGIEMPAVLKVFRTLHGIMSAIHHEKVVIGDFNYLNVLVRGETPYLIDADSFQYGTWLTKTFTSRFVDPLICDPKGHVMVQVQPHSAATDWYAYALMLFECLLFVGPYGGVYRPREKTVLVPQDARPLKRISVFHPDVIYPVKAQPLTSLPKPVAEFYGKLLVDDWRGQFPLSILDMLQAHADGRVYEPKRFSPQAGTREIQRAHAGVRKRFEVGGNIECAVLQNGKLYVVFHDGAQFKREDGTAVLGGVRDPNLHFRISGNRTIAAKNGMAAVLSPGEAPVKLAVDNYRARLPVFDANARHYYWVSQGILYRDDISGPRAIGTVLKNQTLIWVGSTFGVGLSRTGVGLGAFVFDAERPGINDSLLLSPPRGEILETACYFSSNRAWLFMTIRRRGDLVNRCVTIAPDGKVSTEAEEADGSLSWLGSIYSKCAATVPEPTGSIIHRLFAVTESGLVGIDDQASTLTESTHYPSTERLVLHDAPLLSHGAGSILQVDQRAIWELTFS